MAAPSPEAPPVMMAEMADESFMAEAYRGGRPHARDVGACGKRSPQYFQRSLDSLASVFPDARRITFEGLGHEASGNAQWRGKPEVVARNAPTSTRQKRGEGDASR